MNWKLIMVTLFLMFLAVPVTSAQTANVTISTWHYTFPNGDACVHFDWQVAGLQDHTLQIILRGLESRSGDFLLSSQRAHRFADSAGLLTSRLDVVVPFANTEWDDTFVCLPAGQFPDGAYDWFPVITIRDLSSGDLLLLTSLADSIHFGQFADKLPPPNSTPEVSP